MTRLCMLYLIAIVACVNLTWGHGPQEVWITFLSVSLGGIGVSLLQGILPKGILKTLKTLSPSINSTVI